MNKNDLILTLLDRVNYYIPQLMLRGLSYDMTLCVVTDDEKLPCMVDIEVNTPTKPFTLCIEEKDKKIKEYIKTSSEIIEKEDIITFIDDLLSNCSSQIFCVKDLIKYLELNKTKYKANIERIYEGTSKNRGEITLNINRNNYELNYFTNGNVRLLSIEDADRGVNFVYDLSELECIIGIMKAIQTSIERCSKEKIR